MTKKIGRNDPCPCGSGKKYKKCCLGKEDNPIFSDIGKIQEIFKEARKQARFKECLYPDTSTCSEKIIGAHSIQNNKILKKISDNGIIYMPCPKNGLSFNLQNPYGRKEASVFTGFCGHHDKILFQPIEDCRFQATEEQIFLYVYRAFALEYHKMREGVRIEQYFFKNKPSIANISGRTIEGKTAFDMAVSDFAEEKKIFDSAILRKKYDVLTSFVWTFDGFSNFAATGAEAPISDFSGKIIQDILNPNVPARHIYLTVFPEENATYAIIAWLKEYDPLFSTIKERLSALTEQERKNYINNTIPIITENVAIKPSSWISLSDQAKEEFSMLFVGLADLMEMEGQKLNRFDKASFDLFSF